jgi:hypothetical protein
MIALKSKIQAPTLRWLFDNALTQAINPAIAGMSATSKMKIGRRMFIFWSE